MLAVRKVVAVHIQGVKVDHHTQINRVVEVIAALDQKVVVVHRYSIQPIRNPAVVPHPNIQPNQRHIVDHPLNIRLIQNREVVRYHNIQPIQSLAVDQHLSIQILLQM